MYKTIKSILLLMLTISSLYLIWLFPRENQTVIVISRFVLFIICIYINFRTIKKKFFIEENDSLLDEAFIHDNIKTQIKFRTRIILAFIINFILLLSFLEINYELLDVIFLRTREFRLNNLYYYLFYFSSIMNVTTIISLLIDVMTFRRLNKSKNQHNIF
jgi:hypothetical protein